jgi:hypothetical protein
MNRVLYPLLATLALLATAYQVGTMRATRADPARRALVATLASICLAFTFGTPQIYAAADHATGVPNLARLGAHGSATVFGLGLQIMLVYWVYPVADYRRGVRRRLAVWAGASAVMITLFVLGQSEETPYVATRSGDNAFIWAYLAAFSAYLAVALSDIMRLCWRHAAKTQTPLLGVGLRLVAAGCAFGLAYAVEKSVYVGGRALGHHLLPATAQEDLSSTIAATSGLLLLIGFATPSIGQQLMAAYQCRQLRPLWLITLRAAPNVVLSQRFLDQRTRLTRRLVEIHDGRHALQRFLSLDVATHAKEEGSAAGLSGDRLAAYIEATVLLDAAQAKADGHPAALPYEDESMHTDAATNVKWMILVARFVSTARSSSGEPRAGKAILNG